MAGYAYSPLYGVEPFENVAGAPLTNISLGGQVETFGGGAKITNNNLLVTLWGNLENAAPPANPFPIAGDLLQPADSVTGQVSAYAQDFQKGLSQVFDSRTTAKFRFQQTDGEGAFVETPLMAVLNPPAEIKNYYQRVMKVVNNEPTFLRSALDMLVWEAQFFSSDFSLSLTNAQGLITAGNSLGFPLLKTSGADGVFPEFYPVLSQLLILQDVAGIKAYLEAIADGDFFIPVLIQPTTPPPASEDPWGVKITWPHSIAR
jgi:hypothetical protein